MFSMERHICLMFRHDIMCCRQVLCYVNCSYYLGKLVCWWLHGLCCHVDSSFWFVKSSFSGLVCHAVLLLHHVLSYLANLRFECFHMTLCSVYMYYMMLIHIRSWSFSCYCVSSVLFWLYSSCGHVNSSI